VEIMTLILFLVESGLELIPKEIRNHPSVIKTFDNAKYSSQLLDNALHHSAMKKLKNFEKRGRPDIVHNCLLNALGSPLNKSGSLDIYIHTIGNKIFKIDSNIRIARNYNRFKGLMAKLLIKGQIASDDSVLISQINNNLIKLIKSLKSKEILLFSENGKLLQNYFELFKKNLSKNYVVIIGGFQKSNFSQEILDLSDKIFSISQYSLDAWVVVNKIISYYEIIHDIK